MSSVLRLLPALALTAGLAVILTGATQAQAPPTSIPPQAKDLTTRLAKDLRVLREDMDIDLPDARGESVGRIVDGAVGQVRQMQKAVRDRASAEHLRARATDLDKDLNQLQSALSGLGSDAYYLRKSAGNIHAVNHSLLKLLTPPVVPPQFIALTERLVKDLRVLREDTDIDLPDARGEAVGRIIDRCVAKVRHLQKAARSGATAAHLRKDIDELNEEMARLQNSMGGLGTDGYYLRKSVARIAPLSAELRKLVGPSG